LLEGLEISERCFSDFERTWRIDAEFFQRHHLEIATKLAANRLQPLTSVAHLSDGNHFSISEYFVEKGVPYYRGQDVVGHFFIEQAESNYISRSAYEQPYMRRSHLQSGDVLLSIIGTVGETSLVKSTQEATCSCKLAILRPKEIEPAYLAIYLSSSIGRTLTDRWKRGAVQTGLLLEDMDQLPVPRFSVSFERQIADVVDEAYQALEASEAFLMQAEEEVFRILGLENWVAPEPLTYTRSSSDVFAAGRIDSEYHQPKYENLYCELSTRFQISDLASLGEVSKGITVSYFDDGIIPIVRSGDLGNIDSDDIFLRSDPTEPVFFLEKGDVLISSIGFGSIGKVQVFDKEGQYGTVSEVTVVRQKKVNPYYLAAFFRSKAGQMQIERHITGATGQLHLYPRDVAKFWIPVLPNSEQFEFESLAKSSVLARKQAVKFLDAAKHAVELAIVKSEVVAHSFLSGVGKWLD